MMKNALKMFACAKQYDRENNTVKPLDCAEFFSYVLIILTDEV